MADMDLDLDDGLNVPKRAPSRQSRFAPKGSKIKPKMEPGVSSEPQSSSHQSVESSVLSKEELDSKAPLPVNLAAAAATAAKNEEASASHDVAMLDVNDTKPEEGHPKDENMELNQNEEGENEVIREIDVYFKPSLGPNRKLYVFQYPLRPKWRPYPLDETCEEVRVRTDSSGVDQFEMDLKLDDESPNYDQNVDAKNRITKQTLVGTMANSPESIRHAVGVLRGDKLYLNLIHGVVQFRPSLQRSRENSTANNATKKEEKPVVSAKKKNEASTSAFSEQTKGTGEDWTSLKYNGRSGETSARVRQKMVEVDETPIPFLMSRKDYVNALCPGRTLNDNDSNGSNYPSKKSLLTLPLEERIRTILHKGPPIHRFDALKNFAPEVSVEDTLGVLRRHARLIQGLWVPKSEGEGPEVLAREYVLSRFRKCPIINDKEISKFSGQKVKTLRHVLKTLAIFRPTLSDWKFKEPPDVSFMKLYPDIVKKEEQVWTEWEPIINAHMNGGKDTTSLKSSIKQTPKSSKGGQSRIPMSDETRQALPKTLNKIFKDHKVCSFQQICQRLREMAVSKTSHPKGDAKEILAAAKGVDAPMDELQAVIGQVAINIHGVYVPLSSPDHPEHDAFRKVVIDLFLAEGPNAKLKKASIVEAAKLQLKVDDIGQNVYQKVLNEICVSTKGSCWVLKTGEGNPR